MNKYKQMHEKLSRCIKAVLIMYIGLSLGSFSPAWALEPPRPGEIEKLKAESKFENRLRFVESIGNHKVASHLVERFKLKFRNLIPVIQGLSGFAPLKTMGSLPPGVHGMPSIGNDKTFALLIEFNEYPHTVSQAVVDSMLYGAGNPANFSNDSLTNYYDRSSYSLLDLGDGTTFAWWNGGNRSDVTENDAGREGLIKNAINHFDGLGHDFSQYDNDGDGYIDYFIVFWTGPDTGWGTFWWGYQPGWTDGTYTIDGKNLSSYSWQWEADNPTVVIHETGHALGLPDLYDYDVGIGPEGGVGGFDMMDANRWDHNCFSKWMLDWLTPSVVSGGRQDLTLDDTATTTDCVLIWPGVTTGDIFSEFFMAQNRQAVANDDAFDGWFNADGFSVWHIDAHLDGSGNYFLYNNSNSAHKLVRLMEADGEENLETGMCIGGPGGVCDNEPWSCDTNENCWFAEGNDLYNNGDEISPSTFPSSNRYDGSESCVRIWNIADLGVAAGAEISASFSTICNQPPVCNASGGYSVECSGGTTAISLNGSGSSDPDDDPLTFSWTTDCPGGSFDNSASSTPLLTVDTSPLSCPTGCNVTLTVSDPEGDSDTCSTSITINDTQPPVISYCPVNVTIECDEPTDPSNTGSATATDACDVSPLITHADTITPGTCPDEWQITRIWTANDDCGHSSSCQQTINVEDNTAPAITCPSDITIECDESTDPLNTGSAIATDNCDDNPTVTFADLVASDPSCSVEKTITRTWSAADACGNVNSCSQVITVEDTTAPVIACNAPATITPPDAPISFTASATDNCDTNPSVAVTAYDCFTYTKKGKRIDKRESCVVQMSNNVVTILDSGGVADTITWTVRSSDCAGNVSTGVCSANVVNPAK
jgi:M6 family metalloprotease-like protein